MLTVRVSRNRVRIDVDRRRSRRPQEPVCIEKEPQAAPVPQPPISAEPHVIDGDVADAITLWSLGRRGGLAAAMLTSGFVCQELFRCKPRELLLHEDHILLCGLEVWRECGQTHLRDALALLSRRDAHGFVRVKGTKLSKDLGRDSTNHIGKPIADFCNRVSEVLGTKGIACERDDVLQNSGGGYHFREWMEVRVIGSWATPLGIDAEQPAQTCSGVQSSTPWNERQQWILAQIAKGIQIRQKDVVVHFRSQWNASTLKRDLKALRESGQITTTAAGVYIRS